MDASAYPRDLLYNREHQWLRLEGEVARSGITAFGQQELGDIVFVSGPRPGDRLARGEKLMDIESVKVVWELFMPLSGEIVEVNEELDATPELINRDPYGRGWLVAIRFSDRSELDAFLDAAAYEAFLASRPRGQ